MGTFTIKRGDRLPAISATLMQGVGTADEAAADVTAAVSVKFLMRPEGFDAPTVDAAAEWVDQSASTVRYQWAANDTATAGRYRCEWEVTFPGSKKSTFPSTGYDLVHITADIA